jgi:hypothetical protein
MGRMLNTPLLDTRPIYRSNTGVWLDPTCLWVVVNCEQELTKNKCLREELKIHMFSILYIYMFTPSIHSLSWVATTCCCLIIYRVHKAPK